MSLEAFTKTSFQLWRAAAAFVTKTHQRKWTAAGVALAFGLALIAVPPLGIAVFGGAFAGWWLVVAIVTLFGGMAGNRWGVEVERRQSQKE